MNMFSQHVRHAPSVGHRTPNPSVLAPFGAAYVIRDEKILDKILKLVQLYPYSWLT